MFNFFSELINQYNIKIDNLLGYQFINISGKLFYLEGKFSILNIESKNITIKLKKSILSICGSDLVIKEMSDGILVISGNISLIEVL